MNKQIVRNAAAFGLGFTLNTLMVFGVFGAFMLMRPAPGPTVPTAISTPPPPPVASEGGHKVSDVPWPVFTREPAPDPRDIPPDLQETPEPPAVLTDIPPAAETEPEPEPEPQPEPPPKPPTESRRTPPPKPQPVATPADVVVDRPAAYRPRSLPVPEATPADVDDRPVAYRPQPAATPQDTATVATVPSFDVPLETPAPPVPDAPPAQLKLAFKTTEVMQVVLGTVHTTDQFVGRHAAPNHQYIIVPVTLVGGTDTLDLGEGAFQLLDRTGVVYLPRPELSTPILALAPGSTVEGRLVFEVPLGVQPDTVAYSRRSLGTVNRDGF